MRTGCWWDAKAGVASTVRVNGCAPGANGVTVIVGATGSGTSLLAHTPLVRVTTTSAVAIPAGSAEGSVTVRQSLVAPASGTASTGSGSRRLVKRTVTLSP